MSLSATGSGDKILIAKEDIKLVACETTITVANKGERLVLVSKGYGGIEVRPVDDVNAATFIVQEHQVFQV